MVETEDDLRRKIARLEDRNARLTAMVEDLHRKWGKAEDQAARLAKLLVAAAEKADLEAAPYSRDAPYAIPDRHSDTRIAADEGKSDI
ncbi:putative nuclease with TOPRIM domain [Xanthobacter flavus]|uniref:Nuclease with TOPRIM domain n=1 Tax=Xanthobacter flavus TaxID=281 RepID=A0A9W6CR37_XANFL|nr:hypothetical protein [Xanthobacter flavus]MDR6336754.1 putative nuclease with TOPRIM domain [Xanthobacter flavus]GLI25309.1 hypothetical protein XFLAVUS301_49830 [Xanthobacter flavus]